MDRNTEVLFLRHSVENVPISYVQLGVPKRYLIGTKPHFGDSSNSYSRSLSVVRNLALLIISLDIFRCHVIFEHTP